jgi:hypothetical protein
MNQRSGIILGGDMSKPLSPGVSTGSPIAPRTKEGIPLVSSETSGYTSEGVLLIGNKDITPVLSRPPPLAPNPISPPSSDSSPITKGPSTFGKPSQVVSPRISKQSIKDSSLTPWSDNVANGENINEYYRKNRLGLELVIVYDIVVAILFVIAYLRYRKDHYFWTIFTISIVWAVFGSMSIWYGTLHGDLIVGIVLTVVFIVLLFAYGSATLEPRHQLYIKHSS